MVKDYEYEKGLYEYVDDEGYKRIGKWEQKYVGDRDYYSPGDRLMDRKKVGVVDFWHEDDDDYVDDKPDKRRECPHCLEYEIHNKLGPRMLKQGEKPAVDDDLFLSCYQCGNTFPKHEIEKQKMLKSDTKQHTTDNEFESKQSIVIGIPKRTSPAGKKASAKRRRERERAHHSDKDIDMEIRTHGEDNVKVVYDSNP